MRKVIKYFAITTSGLLLLLISSVGIVYFFYADQIIRYTIDQLNKSLSIRIDVQKISFEPLKNFPHAAVVLQNAIASTTNSQVDTLLSCEQLSLQFNWIKIFKQQYVIEGIGITNAKIHLCFDSSGNFAHQILKSDLKSDSVTNPLAIHHFWLKNSQLNISTPQLGLISADIKQLNFNGEMKLKLVKGKIQIQGKNAKFTMNQEQKTITQFFFTSNCFYNNFQVKLSGELEINKENFFIQFTSNKQLQKFDIEGNKIRLQNLSMLVPSEIFKQLPNPKLDLSAQVTKQMSGRKRLDVTAQCRLNNNEITLPDISGHISGNLRYIGNLTDSIHRIEGTNITLNTAFSHINFSGTLCKAEKNWSTEAAGICKLEIREIKQYFDSLPLQLQDGTSNFKFVLKKESTSLEKIFNVEGWQYSLEGKLENATGKFNGTSIDSLTTIFLIQPGIFQLPTLVANWENNSWHFSGRIEQKNSIGIVGNINFDNLILDKILSIVNSSNNSGSNINLLLQVSAAAGSYKNSPFKQLQLKLFSTDSVLKIQNLSVHFLSGKINNLFLSSSGSNYSLETQAEKIDVTQLIQLLENFGFSPIKTEMVSGKLNAKVNLKWIYQNDKIQFDKTLGDIEIIINQGRLIQYPPLKDVMKYINLREPEDVRFKPLKIRLNIKDNTVWIEPVHIQSSAIDFTTWGSHSFDNKYEYHFKFYLSDVMKKQNVDKKQDIPVTEIEDSTKMAVVFVLLKGTGSQYKISYDTRASLDNFRLRWKAEQKNLGTILKEEFKGSANRDITEQSPQHNKKAAPTVIMEEEGKKGPNQKPSTNTSRKRPAIEWKDEDN
ncbi:MAG: AsmA-like C-terminal region-containing protein [Bacteroidales bacterium]